MVDINLIPAALRKNSKGPSGGLKLNIPHDILLGVGSALVLLIVSVHLVLSFSWLLVFGQFSLHNAQWQQLAPDKKILDAINDESKDLKKKIGLISDMTTKKGILWAPKFNAISDALPRGLWIRKMTLDKTGLLIEGSVVSKTSNEINNVGSFLSVLKQDDGFIRDFSSLEVNSIQRGHNSSVEITDFTAMAKVYESKSK